jgi:hypothetical protein
MGHFYGLLLLGKITIITVSERLANASSRMLVFFHLLLSERFFFFLFLM